jgi:ubiquinone/menaquinone biosynthesis C-methylase UbiE
MVNAVRRFCGDLGTEAPILDVGCGNGLFWHSLFGARPAVGVDYSLGMCALARARGMAAYHADALALPFAAEQFEFAYSIEILQYIDDLPAFLAELARVCRPGGRIVVSTLNRSSLLRRTVRTVQKFVPRPHATSRRTIIMRSAGDIQAAGLPSGLQVRAVCWSHFPFPWDHCSGRPRYLLNPLASNVIVEFAKPTRQ